MLIHSSTYPPTLNLPINPFVHPLIYLSIHPSIYACMHKSIYLSIHSSTNPITYLHLPSIHLSTHQSIYLPIHLFILPPVHPLIHSPSTHTFINPHTHPPIHLCITPFTHHPSIHSSIFPSSSYSSIPTSIHHLSALFIATWHKANSWAKLWWGEVDGCWRSWFIGNPCIRNKVIKPTPP